MKRIWTSLFICLGVAGLQAAPGFNRDVAPIFKEYCAGCHSGSDPDGAFSVESLSSLLKGGESGAAVVPGDASQSLLIRLIKGVEKPKMPPRREPQLSDEQKRILSDWVAAGAMPGEGGGETMRVLSVPEVKAGEGAYEAITSMELSTDGRLMALGRFGRVDVVHANDSRLVRRFEGLPGKVNSVHFSRSGKEIIAASGVTGLRGEARMWDLKSGKLLAILGEGHTDVLFDAEISPDGKLVATAGYDRLIRLWRLEDAFIINTLDAHNGAIFDLAFNRDGSILASSSADETTKLWRVSDGVRLDTLNQPQGEQFSVVFSPDDSLVFSAGADNRIRMWKLVSREKPEINPLIHARFAHEDDILRLLVDPQGEWLATSSADHSIKLWSLPELALQRIWEGQKDVSNAMATDGKGNSITAAWMDGSMKKFAVEFMNEAVAGTGASNERGHAAGMMGEQRISKVKESEPNNQVVKAQPLSIPAEVEGAIGQVGDEDFFAFDAKEGEEWMFDIEASRKKSPLDSKLVILDDKGEPVLQAKLQAVRDSWLTFRGKDSMTANDFRLHNWREMELNEYLFVNGEVVKLFLYPRGPDSGFQVYPGFGQRHTFFGTTAKAHPLGQNCYIVKPFPPDAEPSPNGLPVFPVYFENDDEPLRRWGEDSQLRFDVPKTGRYVVKVSDVRGFGGGDFHYKLSVRPRTPDFTAKITGANPKISPGSGREFSVEIDRIDGFEGEVRIEVGNLPPGFSASSPITIEAGHFKALGVVNADANAVAPGADWKGKTKLTAHATIRGEEISKEIGTLGEIKLSSAPKVIVSVKPDGKSGAPIMNEDGVLELILHPGETITAMVNVERNDFDGRIPFGKEDSGRNLPHGVYVDNIGLNGLLIVEKAMERQFFITAAPWVPETTRHFHLRAEVDGNQISRPVILKIRREGGLAGK